MKWNIRRLRGKRQSVDLRVRALSLMMSMILIAYSPEASWFLIGTLVNIVIAARTSHVWSGLCNQGQWPFTACSLVSPHTLAQVFLLHIRVALWWPFQNHICTNLRVDLAQDYNLLCRLPSSSMIFPKTHLTWCWIQTCVALLQMYICFIQFQ